jgi:predicted tellurium resistance membrane protein TerC
MFWSWRILRRLYAGLVLLMAIAFSALLLTSSFGFPPRVQSTIIVVAMIAWIVMGVAAVIWQGREDRRKEEGNIEGSTRE